MRFDDARATHVIAVLTFTASALILMLGWDNQAALGGGFIPARAGGAIMPPDFGPVAPTWLTPLTATLIHGNFIHLLFNGVMLVYCGRESERALGPTNIGILYLVGAYVAALGQWLQDPMSTAPMIGASGAISAIVAAYALLYGRSRTRAIGPVPAALVHALWLAAAWTVINLLIDFATSGGARVAIGAHIGGFLAGLVLTRPLLLWRYRRA
ncbi:rhomboid family intramembrane serine protease [uncultured Sphingomonas sp.]|uniref:rhomboid family intramembrane serine protease n=1 Tax=uncultured Sphingomonas sp. TaxID=158754 RepID=UPI0035CA4A5A